MSNHSADKKATGLIQILFSDFEFQNSLGLGVQLIFTQSSLKDVRTNKQQSTHIENI